MEWLPVEPLRLQLASWTDLAISNESGHIIYSANEGKVANGAHAHAPSAYLLRHPRGSRYTLYLGRTKPASQLHAGWATQPRIRLRMPPQALIHQRLEKRRSMESISRAPDTPAVAPMPPRLWERHRVPLLPPFPREQLVWREDP